MSRSKTADRLAWPTRLTSSIVIIFAAALAACSGREVRSDRYAYAKPDAQHSAAPTPAVSSEPVAQVNPNTSPSAAARGQAAGQVAGYPATAPGIGDDAATRGSTQVSMDEIGKELSTYGETEIQPGGADRVESPQTNSIPVIRTVQYSADLNRVTPVDLAALGVPADLAIQIVRYRDAHGAFRSVDSLRDVPDMTDEIFALIRGKFAVRHPSAPAGDFR